MSDVSEEEPRDVDVRNKKVVRVVLVDFGETTPTH